MLPLLKILWTKVGWHVFWLTVYIDFCLWIFNDWNDTLLESKAGERISKQKTLKLLKRTRQLLVSECHLCPWASHDSALNTPADDHTVTAHHLLITLRRQFSCCSRKPRAAWLCVCQDRSHQKPSRCALSQSAFLRSTHTQPAHFTKSRTFVSVV